MLTFVRIAFFLFLALAVAAWFHKDALPPHDVIQPQLQIPPTQEPVQHAPVTLEKDGTEYTINPLYSYTLRGLVVSYHDSQSWLDYMHSAWGDTLNVRDLCVVWGDNVKNGLYDKFNFKSGDFTCFYETTNQQAWNAFRQDQISNNHLLAGTATIQEKIAHAEHGDQIAFQGFLASYSHGENFKRGTSTRRDDTGNGACETVFVTNFTMLHKANTFWRQAWDISVFGAAITLLAWLALFVSDAVSTDYKTADSYHQRGVELAARGKLRRALAMLDKSLELDPELVEAYQDRALLRQRLGQSELAEQDLELARRIEQRRNAHSNL